MTKYEKVHYKAFLSPFVDGMVVAQILARRYAIPPTVSPDSELV